MTKKTKKKPTSSKAKQARGNAMLKRRFPVHLSVDTPAEWRGLKRTEWREVVQALERYHYGSAFTPAKAAFDRTQQAVRQVTEAIEADDWIAW